MSCVLPFWVIQNCMPTYILVAPVPGICSFGLELQAALLQCRHCIEERLYVKRKDESIQLYFHLTSVLLVVVSVLFKS